MYVTNDYIEELFLDTCFGDVIDNNISEKRKLLAKTLKNLVVGYWSGHTAYHIALDGGFIYDGKKSEPKRLTYLGREFLKITPLNEDRT